MVYGEFAFVLSGDINQGGSVRLVNISDPQNLALGTLYQTTHQVHDIAFVEDMAFIATSAYNGFTAQTKILDISSPNTPAEIGSFDQGGTGMAIVNNTIYLSGDGLQIFSIGKESIYLPTIVR